MCVGFLYTVIDSVPSASGLPMVSKKGMDPWGSIYWYQCGDLGCDEEYIGETSRTFGERYKEHLKAPSASGLPMVSKKEMDPWGSIYWYQCGDLGCDEEYIGETSRTFGERYKEHLKAPSASGLTMVSKKGMDPWGSIYWYQCGDLGCDEEYIGETSRTFGERYKEHLKAPSASGLTMVSKKGMDPMGPAPSWTPLLNQRLMAHCLSLCTGNPHTQTSTYSGTVIITSQPNLV